MLYHYTSIDSFVGMMEGAKRLNMHNHLVFWASSIYTMNDPEEFIHGKRIVDNLAKKYEKEKYINEEYRLSTAFDEYSKSDPSFGTADEICERYFTNYPKTPFVLSFSKNEDDLSMWTRYGERGRGVCLAFSEDMSNYTLNDNIVSDNPTEVEYSEEIENNEYLYNKFRKTYQESIEAIKPLNEEELISQRMFHMSRLYAFLCPFIKCEDYSQEKEVRIAAYLNSWDSIKFRSRNGIIVPYVEAPISLDYLREIKLGPCCNDDLTKHGVGFILNARGHNHNPFDKKDVDIKKSGIPFRTL